MEIARHFALLGLFAVGFLAIGAGVGLMVYHFGLGWFISHTSKRHLDSAVTDAERHLARRWERRNGRARRRKVLVDNGVVAGGKHLSR
jgi:hypothetical protein